MHDPRKRLSSLTSLERLHQSRIRVCEIRYQEQKRKQEEAVRCVREREMSISQLKGEHSNLFTHLGREAVAKTPARVERVHVRRYWVQYDLEKDEYYLEIDRQDLGEAESKLSQARREWLRARKRQDVAQQQQASLRRDISRRSEQRETED